MFKALHYLHTEAKLLHGDIKSYNILIKNSFETCKLCDFGVSLPIDSDGFLDLAKKPNSKYIGLFYCKIYNKCNINNFLGTDLWSAPEVLLDDNERNISSKADIFSFGLVIYECIALVPPHTLGINDDVDISMTQSENSDTTNVDEANDDEANDDTIALCGTRPPIPDAYHLSDDYNVVIEVFYVCTNSEPEDRPSANYLCQILN